MFMASIHVRILEVRPFHEPALRINPLCGLCASAQSDFPRRDAEGAEKSFRFMVLDAGPFGTGELPTRWSCVDRGRRSGCRPVPAMQSRCRAPVVPMFSGAPGAAAGPHNLTVPFLLPLAKPVPGPPASMIPTCCSGEQPARRRQKSGWVPAMVHGSLPGSRAALRQDKSSAPFGENAKGHFQPTATARCVSKRRVSRLP